VSAGPYKRHERSFRWQLGRVTS